MIAPPPVDDQPTQEQPLRSELLFEPNSATLLAQAKDALALLARRIIDQGVQVHLVGHVWKVTDSDDAVRAGELSTARAQAVRDLLVELQVPRPDRRGPRGGLRRTDQPGRRVRPAADCGGQPRRAGDPGALGPLIGDDRACGAGRGVWTALPSRTERQTLG